MPDTAVLVLSDIHYGKKTDTFDPGVCIERLKRCADEVLKVQKEKKLTELVVLLVGDINDGTDIYATQPHHQAVSNVEQQADEIADALAVELRRLAAKFVSVRVECVAGNHGRGGKMTHEAASWDIVTYRYLKLKLTETKNVAVHVGGDPFLKVVKVRGHGILMYHGHNIKMVSGVPWNAIGMRLMRWGNTSLPAFTAAVMGHFHTLGHWTLNKIKLFSTGAFISDDKWALEVIGWDSKPSTWLLGVNEKEIGSWLKVIDLS